MGSCSIFAEDHGFSSEPLNDPEIFPFQIEEQVLTVDTLAVGLNLEVTDFKMTYKHKSPYEDLPPKSFWKTGVAMADPDSLESIYTPKFGIQRAWRIATIGSCFAQYIHRYLSASGLNVIDLEPPPLGLPDAMHAKYGYSIYSARYGNIYTMPQLLQLTKEALGAVNVSPSLLVWEKDGAFYDSLRPGVEPDGLRSAEEVLVHRALHLARVRDVFVSADVFIITLGLTEYWEHRREGIVFPSAPGVIAGSYSDQDYFLHNSLISELIACFDEFMVRVGEFRQGSPFHVVLTVSPVPMTATATGSHVLVANSYSKSTMRSLAGYATCHYQNVDYFPSYELITNPRLHSTAYQPNLRSVRPGVVSMALNSFARAHGLQTPLDIQEDRSSEQSPQHPTNLACEEALLGSFNN
jgi:hypothetical protein